MNTVVLSPLLPHGRLTRQAVPVFRGEIEDHSPTTITGLPAVDEGVQKARRAILDALRIEPESRSWSQYLLDHFWPFGVKPEEVRFVADLKPADIKVIYPTQFETFRKEGYLNAGIQLQVKSHPDQTLVVETLKQKLGLFLPVKEGTASCYMYFDTPVEFHVKADRPG